MATVRQAERHRQVPLGHPEPADRDGLHKMPDAEGLGNWRPVVGAPVRYIAGPSSR